MFICVYIKKCTHAKYEKFLNKACNSTKNRLKVFVHCNYQFIHKVIRCDFWQNVNIKLDLYKSIIRNNCLVNVLDIDIDTYILLHKAYS